MSRDSRDSKVPRATERVDVPTDLLRRPCDPGDLGLATTEELAAADGAIGQDRGVNAIDFGLGISEPGYNLFVARRHGTGRRTSLLTHLRRRAAQRPKPPEWVYLFNFNDPARPGVTTVSAPAGGVCPSVPRCGHAGKGAKAVGSACAACVAGLYGTASEVVTDGEGKGAI